MSLTCPYCLTTDLPEAARKCRACGSWLDPAQDKGTLEAVRLALREELRADVKEHRAYLEGLLSQLKYVAALVVAVGLAATVYFGVRTDRSISDTAATIATTAGKQIEAAAETVKAEAQTKVQALLDSQATADLIRSVIVESVATETTSRVQSARDEIEKQIADAQKSFGKVNGTIETLIAETERATELLDPIRKARENTLTQTVQGSQSVLPVSPVHVEEKGGLLQLQAVLDARIGALGFQQGNYYEGPVVWAYVDRLRLQAGFRDVLVTTADNALFGLFDAARLAKELDPPDAADLRQRLEGDLATVQLPSSDTVQGWSAFADAVTEGNLGFVASLPGFVPAEAAVGADWTSLRALDHMERLGAERLPVVDGRGAFVGIIERSRLTTRVLLEVAGGG